MREILFRGKRVHDGKWVEGYYVHERTPAIKTEHHVIFSGNNDYSDQTGTSRYESWWVEPSSVGQYTGLTDKNGVRIFEGDIVSIPCNEYVVDKIWGCCGYDADGYPKHIRGFEGYGEYPHWKTTKKNCVVIYDATHGCYAKGTSFELSGIDTQVVGNIIDNPELLEEKEEK